MIANDNLFCVFMCFLFVLSRNWIGEIRVFVLSSDECYFPWPFVKVDFVKKKT